MQNKKMKTRAEMTVIAIAVIAVVALVNYASNRFFFRLDLTENKQFTVSDATRRILRNLDDIVTIRAFFSKDLPPETHTTVNTVRDLLEEYRSIAGGRLRIVWEDPAGNEDAAGMARSLGVPEITLQTVKQDRVEAMRGYMGIGIMYADKREAIPIVQNLHNLEYDLTRAITRVKQASAPKIGVLKSQPADFIPQEFLAQMNMGQETTERKFAPIFDNFRDDFEVVAVNVMEGEPVDREIRTLIIPGGNTLTDRAIFEIDQYFMNGGNLIVLASGVNVTFGQFGPQSALSESKLIELMEFYGVRIERNLIMDASSGFVQVPRNLGFITINERLPYLHFVRVFEDGFAQDNPAVSSQSELMLPWPSSLTSMEEELAVHRAEANLLISSSEASWPAAEGVDLAPQAETEYIRLMQEMQSKDALTPHNLAFHVSGNFNSFFKDRPIPPVREESEDEDENSLNQINLLESDTGREVTPSNVNGNLVVIGNSDFISAHYASRQNITFMHNLVDWLSSDNNLIAVRSRVLRDKTINPNILEAGSSKPGIIRWINLLLMPTLAAAAGIAISLKRREKITPTPTGAATAAAAGTPAAVSTNNDEENSSNG